MATTIQLDNSVKEKLDSMKVYRETYNDLLIRMLDNCNSEEPDKESLIATIEVLSDPELMKGIKEALTEESGVSWKKIKEDLNLDV